MTFSATAFLLLCPIGAIVALAIAPVALAVGHGRAVSSPGLARFVIVCIVAGAAAVPVVLMAANADNSSSPTPLLLGIAAMAAPVVAAAVACRVVRGVHASRWIAVVAVLSVAGLAQAVVAVDAFSCVDDDCVRLPVILRPVPIALPWLAGLALWLVEPRPLRPIGSLARRVGGPTALVLAGIAGCLALWPNRVSGSYVFDPGRDAVDQDLPPCGIPIVDALGDDEYSVLWVTSTDSVYGSLDCRAGAERRILAAEALVLVALLAWWLRAGSSDLGAAPTVEPRSDLTMAARRP